MSPENLERLKAVFQFSLDLEEGSDLASLRMVAEPRWDSLAHTTLIAGIESEFGLILNVDDIVAINSFASAQLILEEKGV